MKAPGIFDGVIVAIIISVFAAIAGFVFAGVTVYSSLFSLVLCGSGLIYLVYLLRRSQARVGRVIVVASWAIISIGCWFLQVPLFAQVLLQAGLIWLVRSLYFHGSLLSAMLDGGLVFIGLVASAWAMTNTGSLTGAVWSFFLVQALFCWIPDLSRREPGRNDLTREHQSSFQTAHRVALDAVRKLTQA